MNPPVRTWDALLALKRGIAMSFGDDALRARMVVSIIVNAIAFLGLLAMTLWGAMSLVDLALTGPEVADPTWYQSLWYGVREGFRWLVNLALIIGALLYSPVLFTLLASALLPAFAGPVFRMARSQAGGPEVPGRATAFPTVVWVEVTRLARFILWSALLLPLNLIPGIGSVAYIVAQFYLSARTLGWDLLSHHFEMHGLGMEAQKAFVRERRGLVLAFGAGATLLATLPLVQLVFITTNVASAGVLSAWLDGALRES